MKKILGLDLGTTSIGWAYVKEAENSSEQSEIVRLGVRVNPLSTDEQTDFEKGKSITVNADRTSKRGARRGIQRFKQRRANLINTLKSIGFIDDNTVLTETGENSTHNTLLLRAKAAKEKIEKDEFARVLLSINKKRGYKSSRKAKNEEEGTLIDGMEIAKQLYQTKCTPGQLVFNLLKDGGKFIPDFYRSDLKNEFDAIWNNHANHYPEVLNTKTYNQLQDVGKMATSKILLKEHNIYTADIKGSRDEKKLKTFELRSKAITEKLSLDSLAYVLAEVNNNLNSSSGYLGAISDRSKELYFNKQTVGEFMHAKLSENPNYSFKNQVFYRQDYMDEFEVIWETQAKYYPELTNNIKHEIRDITIFYQRPLKSQKHLISNCEFEKYHKAIPKSSPLFQEFKVWQVINNIEVTQKSTKTKYNLDIEQKKQLFAELNIRGKLKDTQVLELLFKKPKEWSINYKEVEGNNTNKALFDIYKTILHQEGYDIDFEKISVEEIIETTTTIFKEIGINADILNFNTNLSGNEFDKQPSYQLWHILYSIESDKEVIKALQKHFGFKENYARLLSNIRLQSDYGSLSARAISKIIPFLKEGNQYDVACDYAKYNHSSYLTKEEIETRILSDKLNILKKNSLRNPVVEKILNQMVNVVNAIIDDPDLGKPDEVRVELARELKKSAKERENDTLNINKAKINHEKIRDLLSKEFGIKNPTRNDIIRYKLYCELESNGFKTLYSNTYIPREKLFSKEIDIEHIIPKAKLFDDSFSNKTLEYRNINLEKGDKTAIDFISEKYDKEFVEEYKGRIERLYKAKTDGLSKGKYLKLLMAEKDIPSDFIDRDLRNSQYIAKMATQMLNEVIRKVYTTTGSVTSRLREDWGLVDTMKELNFGKYKELGLIETIEGKNGESKERIKDWSKRNDHRHHAMDALTIAFTKHSFIQYLNNLNARSIKTSDASGIEQKELYRNDKGKLLFKKPFDNFRGSAKTHLESILISFKAKNKVVTKNINKTKQGGNKLSLTKVQLTPRGQLHKETIYGSMKQAVVKEEKIGLQFTAEYINNVTKPIYKEALLKRLNEFGGDPKKAFTAKNSLAKNPIYLDADKTLTLPEKVKVKLYEVNYTIRKEISPELKIEKVIDLGIQKLLYNRLKEFNGNSKLAFSNLDKNPIWINKEKGVSLKRVRISGVKNTVALHDKRNNRGELLLDSNGKSQPVDFVSTGNNHHIAIYEDEKGKLQEKVVSFFEAVSRVNAGLPIIDKEHNSNLGWKFMFTLKSNEMFLFPSDGFDPKEYDLLSTDNMTVIAKNLYRVQKIATKNYMFRHHLETNVDEAKELKNIAYKNLRNTEALKEIIKIRINHLGRVVHVGEY